MSKAMIDVTGKTIDENYSLPREIRLHFLVTVLLPCAKFHAVKRVLARKPQVPPPHLDGSRHVQVM